MNHSHRAKCASCSSRSARDAQSFALVANCVKGKCDH